MPYRRGRKNAPNYNCDANESTGFVRPMQIVETRCSRTSEYVTLQSDRGPKVCSVQALVATTFIENKDKWEDTTINHIASGQGNGVNNLVLSNNTVNVRFNLSN